VVSWLSHWGRVGGAGEVIFEASIVLYSQAIALLLCRVMPPGIPERNTYILSFASVFVRRYPEQQDGSSVRLQSRGGYLPRKFDIRMYLGDCISDLDQYSKLLHKNIERCD